MQPRMKNPAIVIPEGMQPIQALMAAAQKGGVDPHTLALIHLRASQINGCSACVESAVQHADGGSDSHERLIAVAAWRDSPRFSEAERAALELTECVTRLSDRPDPVPDEVWKLATQHYDEKGLAALLLSIATTNVFNRLNVSTRQVAGSWA
jgi:AhpD family alkylhydroperoxidase